MAQTKLTFDGRDFVIESSDESEVRFPMRDDFEYAFDILRRVNALTNKKGVPIYDIAKYKHYSLWPFHLHNFYWEGLRYFLHLRPVITHLQTHSITTVDVETLPPHYHSILALYVTLVNAFEPRKGFLSVYRLMSKVVGALALLKARWQGHRCLLYTPDIFHPDTKCDIRFARAYQLLKKEDIGYTEIFHTNFSRKFLQHLAKRKRLALYRESYTTIDASLSHAEVDCDLSIFNKMEQVYMAMVLDKFRYDSQASLAAIQALITHLKKSPFKVFLAMDDVRYVSEIIIACRECGIRSVGIQHGHFTKHLVGWMNYGIPQDRGVAFDVLYLWNDYWREVLLDYSTHYTKDNTAISGLLRPPKPMELIDRPAPVRLSDMNVLVCCEPLASRREVGEHLGELLEKGAKLFLSIRPDAAEKSEAAILKTYGLLPHENMTIVYKLDANVYNQVDIVVGTYSTFLNEMLLLRKPVGLLETSLTHGHRLLEDDLALPIKLGEYEPILEYLKNYDPEPRIAKVWPASPNFDEVITERELNRIRE